MTETNQTYAIIAFGDIDGPDRRITADMVFDGLFAKGEWYITRPTASLFKGTKVLFYQSGKGIRGSALVGGVIECRTTRILGCQVYGSFSHRLVLDECAMFVEPVSIRPLVLVLDFISNKAHWGQSFRTTPRLISEKDYLAITRQADSGENL
jgi:hypothetical protein